MIGDSIFRILYRHATAFLCFSRDLLSIIIDISSCMYVRRVRAHVTHVTRDSVNGKVRKMILEGVPDAERKREKGEKCGASGSAKIIFPEFCISLRIHFYLYNCAY